jgi:quinol monooxygenase YgiN/mannose-6-phosphate isomerase-like protein (cupin superfamily)
MSAKPGQGEALAQKMLEVAAALRGVAGCQLYVINRAVDDPDAIWVTEQWASREQLDEALQGEGARNTIPQVMALVAEGSFERIDLEPLGGVGYPAGERGFEIVNLDEVEDLAAKMGFGEMGEARFARDPLGAVGTGVSLQRVRPGVRQSFGHSHQLDEEIYVVLSGSGRVAVDDEVRVVRTRDAIRIAPASVRAFEAGPDGLELLAMGAHHPGDPVMAPGWWPGD